MLLHRPKARRVNTTQPKDGKYNNHDEQQAVVVAAESFYQQTYEMGFTNAQVHEVVRNATQDWGEKWYREGAHNPSPHTSLSSPNDGMEIREVVIVKRKRNSHRHSEEPEEELQNVATAASTRVPSTTIITTTPAATLIPPELPFLPNKDREGRAYHSRPPTVQPPQPAPVSRTVVPRQPLQRPVPVRLHRPTPVPSHCILPNPHDVEEGRSLSPLTITDTFSTKTPSETHVVLNDDEEASSSTLSHRSSSMNSSIDDCKDALLYALTVHQGETTSQDFQDKLQVLQDIYTTNKKTTTLSSSQGLWLTLTKPTFFDCLGDNPDGDPMYTLGRMSFDMFGPTNIVCSLQGNYNQIQPVEKLPPYIPKSILQQDGQEQELDIKNIFTYNIVTAFTMEEMEGNPNRRPLRGMMITYGYMIPDPDVPHRHTVWITGGRMRLSTSCPATDDTALEWNRTIGNPKRSRSFKEHATLLALKLFMGAEFKCSYNQELAEQEYVFTRPLGGHGMTYIDTLYMDEDVRIVRGHRGTLFVFSRRN